MADFDPKAYLESTALPPLTVNSDDSKPAFDPKTYLGGDVPEASDHGLSERQKLSPVGKALSPITSYPEVYNRMRNEALDQASEGIHQATHPDTSKGALESNTLWDIGAGAVKATAGAAGYVLSPVSAAYRSVIGQPLEDVTGIPREYTEFAAQLATPFIGLTGPKAIPKVVPPKPTAPGGPFGVTLTKGEQTGDLAARQAEQAALRGQAGKPAQEHAEEFYDVQRPQQLEQAKSDVSKSLDPTGNQALVDNPAEAANMVQQSVQKEAARSKAGVKDLYDRAKALPGEIHADTFTDMPQNIKSDLSSRPDAVIIDDNTPVASRMIKYLDDQIGNLRIKNAASPYPNPPASQIAGVNLEGVEQWRKNLSRMRGDALAAYGTNPSDARAAQAIIKEFDDRIAGAVNSGAFRGDPRAVDLYNQARAAHSERMKLYGNDQVGRRIQAILGDAAHGKDPASLNDVANFMYSASGTSPNSLNIAVAKRLKTILGEDSPEWAAVRQGLFHRLVSTAEGVADRGYGTVANRLGEFLNGKGSDLAGVIFTPQQRNLLSQYADLHNQLKVPQVAANWPNTAAGIIPHIRAASDKILGAIGAYIGHHVVPGLAGEVAGWAVGQQTAKLFNKAEYSRNLKQISQQMPLLSHQLKVWQQASLSVARQATTANRRRAMIASTNLTAALSRFSHADPAFAKLLTQGPSGPGTGNASEQQRARGGKIKPTVPLPPLDDSNPDKLSDELIEAAKHFADGGHAEYKNFRASDNVEDRRNDSFLKRWGSALTSEFPSGDELKSAVLHPLTPLRDSMSKVTPDENDISRALGSSDIKSRADGGAVGDSPFLGEGGQQPNLLEQAQTQYPVLKNYNYGYTENFQPDAGYLEHWEPGDKGADPKDSDGKFNVPRPNTLPLDQHGLEVRDPSTTPGFVAGDMVSHHLKDVDPVVKQTYQNLKDTLTPAQNTRLYDQYGYARLNEGEKGSFEDWKERSGMPGVLRGYAFKQWPDDFNDKFYTPEQKQSLDGMMQYLSSQPKGYADGGTPSFDERFQGTSQDNPSVDDMADQVSANAQKNAPDDSWKDREAQAGLALTQPEPTDSRSLGHRIADVAGKFADYDRQFTSDVLHAPQSIYEHGGKLARKVIGENQDVQDISSPYDPLVIGSNPTEREQTWPERMVRSGATLPHDVATGEVPTYEQDPKTGEWHTSQQMIERAQDTAGMAGSGGLANAEEGAVLNSTPSLRPAMKYKGRIYKGQAGQEHIETLPDELGADYYHRGMTGGDLSDYETGFLNHKGQFMDRAQALDYGIENGLVSPDAKKYGLLTSPILRSETDKPGAALSALEHSEHAQPFYSAVEKTVESAPQQKMQGVQWANWLKNQSGVKPDELQYTGVDNWLREQKGPVTKQQVQDYIGQNKVQVGDVVKGGGRLTPEQRTQLTQEYEAMYGNPPANESELLEFAHDSYGMGDEPPDNVTKYSSYQLPGGENYREHLLTLPDKDPVTMRAKELAEQENGKGSWDRIGGGGQEHYLRDARAERRKTERETGELITPPPTYKSSHWDEPNVLAHARTNERDVAGKPSLHIEELQSDWGAGIRKHGVKQDDLEKAGYTIKKDNDPEINGYLIHKPNGELLDGQIFDTEAEARAGRARLSKSQGLPDMPFKQTEQWASLALKRMIQRAAAEGRDRISWTPGEAQAARYDLSKHLDSIEWSGSKFGYTIHGMKDGRTVFSKSQIPPEELSNVIGKDAADKITKGKDNEIHQRGELKGLDLKVGGEGMKGFYDQMLPKMVEKLSKQYGVKVKEERINKPEITVADMPLADGRTAYDVRINGNLYSSFHTKAEAQVVAAKAEKEKQGTVVKYFDIPEKMKRDVLSKGFPLFSDSSHGAALAGLESRLEALPTIPMGERYTGMKYLGLNVADGMSLRRPKDITKQLKTAPERQFDPKDLLYAQNYLDKDKVKAFLKNSGLIDSAKQPMTVLHQGDKYILSDGTHRAAAAYLLDRPITAKVIEARKLNDAELKRMTPTQKQRYFDEEEQNKQEAEGRVEEKPAERAAGGRVVASNIAIPTKKQKHAGNYSKDHLSVFGLRITVENAKGSKRSGVGKDGKPWESILSAHYGYLKGHEGADGDHVDVYIGPHPKAKSVYIVNQVDPDTKKFDETKAMLCFGSLHQALNTYKKGFSDGRGAERIGSIVQTSTEHFKHWLKHHNTKQPFTALN